MNRSAMDHRLSRKIQSRRYGCAIGAALGDAFGMPLEFLPPKAGNQLVCELTAGRLPAGTITDDTEMALALAESLAAHKPLDAADLAQRFVAWYHSNPPDIGIHTTAVLSAIARGVAWNPAAAQAQANHPDSASNGSLMRCWPVAVAYWDQYDPLAGYEKLIAESALQSRVTHQHEDCVAACVFTNLMIAELICGAEPRLAYQRALEETTLPPGLEIAIRAAPTRQREELPNSGWVHHTLETALWAFLNSSSFAEAIIQSANLGNDADTAASVTGALAGAYYGLENIPAQWRAQLRGWWPCNNPRTWFEADFQALVDQL